MQSTRKNTIKQAVSVGWSNDSATTAKWGIMRVQGEKAEGLVDGFPTRNCLQRSRWIPADAKRQVIQNVWKKNCENDPLMQNGLIAVYYDYLTCAFNYWLTHLACRTGHILLSQSQLLEELSSPFCDHTIRSVSWPSHLVVIPYWFINLSQWIPWVIMSTSNHTTTRLGSTTVRSCGCTCPKWPGIERPPALFR